MKSKADYYDDGTIPWLQSGEIAQGEIFSAKNFITAKGLANSSAKVFPENSVLIAMYGATAGQVGILRFKAATNQAVCAILPSKHFLPQFIFYAMLSKKSELVSRATGNAQPNISQIKVKDTEIPVPPLPEQQRIVAILDDAFEGLAITAANAQRNLRNARELFNSYLDFTFASIEKENRKSPLAALCHSQRVITYGVIKLGDHDPNGVPCLRTSNVRRLRIEVGSMKWISHALSNDYRRTILQGGEVLVNVRGTLGGVAVVEPAMIGWNVSREVAVVPINQKQADPRYVAFWIGAKASQDWLSGVQKGAAYTGINIEDLRTLPVPIPSIGGQLEVVGKLEAQFEMCRQMEIVFDRKHRILEELKQSILHKAFCGELTSPSFTAALETVA